MESDSARSRLRLTVAFMRRVTRFIAANACVHLPLRPGPPSTLFIGLTNHCNLKCTFCFQSHGPADGGLSRPRGYMPLERLDRILDQAEAWVDYVEFGLFGEPSLHPQFMEAVARTVHRGFNLRIDTNGTLIDEDMARQLVHAGPASILFSIEGATAEENAAYRRGAPAEMVEQNMACLARLRADAGKRIPMIVARGLDVAGNDRNRRRRAHAGRMHRLGADRVRWDPVENWTADIAQSEGAPQAAGIKSRTRHCIDPWTSLAVEWDGTVIACCAGVHMRNGLGNVDATSLRDVWRGAKIKALRRALATRHRDTIATQTGCGGCSYLCNAHLAQYWSGSFISETLDDFLRSFVNGGLCTAPHARS